ncbi:hypothetical protein THASP1DRAFT_24216 [Thamnocephalis sphaerospora]|uniref:Uncharacterized protein n=1 Tax=Thamnocephalis sphaerospora TaxID=78915 RepID=A0A4P9XQU8_9FUNG|nr:hypothetical protein THASP1DRAFT_24216 [Thamnocephalis sphaerospora]|eukprot:RKP07680.1 hypothetical protein THASP1DRAFT_24216 [Thamnocephalis sphaerospora]
MASYVRDRLYMMENGTRGRMYDAYHAEVDKCALLPSLGLERVLTADELARVNVVVKETASVATPHHADQSCQITSTHAPPLSAEQEAALDESMIDRSPLTASPIAPSEITSPLYPSASDQDMITPPTSAGGASSIAEDSESHEQSKAEELPVSVEQKAPKVEQAAVTSSDVPVPENADSTHDEHERRMRLLAGMDRIAVFSETKDTQPATASKPAEAPLVESEPKTVQQPRKITADMPPPAAAAAAQALNVAMQQHLSAASSSQSTADEISRQTATLESAANSPSTPSSASVLSPTTPSTLSSAAPRKLPSLKNLLEARKSVYAGSLPSLAPTKTPPAPVPATSTTAPATAPTAPPPANAPAAPVAASNDDAPLSSLVSQHGWNNAGPGAQQPIPQLRPVAARGNTDPSKRTSLAVNTNLGQPMHMENRTRTSSVLVNGEGFPFPMPPSGRTSSNVQDAQSVGAQQQMQDRRAAGAASQFSEIRRARSPLAQTSYTADPFSSQAAHEGASAQAQALRGHQRAKSDNARTMRGSQTALELPTLPAPIPRVDALIANGHQGMPQQGARPAELPSRKNSTTSVASAVSSASSSHKKAASTSQIRNIRGSSSVRSLRSLFRQPS